MDDEKTQVLLGQGQGTRRWLYYLWWLPLPGMAVVGYLIGGVFEWSITAWLAVTGIALQGAYVSRVFWLGSRLRAGEMSMLDGRVRREVPQLATITSMYLPRRWHSLPRGSAVTVRRSAGIGAGTFIVDGPAGRIATLSGLEGSAGTFDDLASFAARNGIQLTLDLEAAADPLEALRPKPSAHPE